VKQTFVTTRLWIVRVALFSLLAAIMSVGTAQAATVSYILDDIFLEDSTQITGAFDWSYTIGEIGDGTGVFTALEIPWRPGGTPPTLEDPNMVITIESNQIEIAGHNSFHDYGLDIILKYEQLSPTLSTLINTGTGASKYECCGNGEKDQAFSGGSITPTASSVPIPAAFPLFMGGLSLLGLLGWRRKRMVAGA
jgi:hypothetical protein